jgi:microcystin-dependent protein
MYTPQGNVTSYETMANSVTLSGNSLPHNNIMPTLTSSYCICLYGIYPTQS